MSLPELTLTTEKNQRNVQANRLTVRESEKGLTLVANIVSGNGLPYDLTGLTLQFCENKQDGKAIIDPAVSVLDSKNGRISYVLHSQAYACSGSAWFEILSGTTLVDSTQNFSIKVESTTNVNVDSSDYIWDTQLENLRTQLQTLVDTMNTTTLPTLNANISAASAKVAQLQQNLNNVDWLSYVKSVNGRKPDSNGNLQVSEYGENLLLNSATMQGTGWIDATQPAANVEDNGDGTLSYVATGQWKSTRYNFSDLIARNVVAIGDVLTYSEDVFIGDGFTQNGGLFVFGGYLGAASANGRIINVGDMKQGWQRVSVTFTVTNPPTSDYLKNALRFEFGGIADTAHFKFRKPKLEHGAATPWCPAPTDNLKALANVYTKAQVDEAIANYVSKYLQTKGS